MPKIIKKLGMAPENNKDNLNKSLVLGDNIINLGKNCLNIRKGVGQKNKNKFKIVEKLTSTTNIEQKLNDDYGTFFWEEKRELSNLVPEFNFEGSIPCAFVEIDCETEFTYKGYIKEMHSTNIKGNIDAFASKLAPRLDTFMILRSLTEEKKQFGKIQRDLKAQYTGRMKMQLTRDLGFRALMSGTSETRSFDGMIKALGLGPKKVKKNIMILNKKKLKFNRYKLYHEALMVKVYYQQLRAGRVFPLYENAKRSILLAYMHRSRRGASISVANMSEQFNRHPVSQFLGIKKYLSATINIERFEKFKVQTKSGPSFKHFYKTVWRYFKLKLERFFYKKLGIRMHIWFMNIWDIFMTGVDSYWRWFKFEDQKIFAMTRKGQRYMIEGREEAKFYLRSMALTLTFGGGVKLFINKVTEMLRQYRNNWAFITYTMESLRLCGNFFWFRFFLNYKVTLQGKIGGILRAAKKTFKKGDVTVEDRSAVVVHHRTFPQSKFGSYCLGFWMQYRVPNLIGTFDELEYIDTMRVLLSMYTIPWLSVRLTEIIEAILREQEIKKQIKFSQYNRRQRARGILASEFRTYIKNTKSKIKKKTTN